MEFSLTTPALLFPAISLLLLAYTNRFLTLASLLRSMTAGELPSQRVSKQVSNFRVRIDMIKRMQAAGVISFFFCVISMFSQHLGYHLVSYWLFAISLIILAYSLYLSVREIWISAEALNIHLEYLDQRSKAADSCEPPQQSETEQ